MTPEFARTILDKVRDDYDTIAADFSATRTALWPDMERFRSFVKAGDHVLDIGCGNGRAYQLFKGMAIEYEGVDLSAKLIEHARQLVRDSLATFRVGSMLMLPYEDKTFDAAIAFASVHHIPSARLRVQALREAWRVLKPGGYLYMTNWDRWKPEFFREHATAFFKKAFLFSQYDFKDVLIPWKGGDSRAMRYYHAFTIGELGKLCTAAGFEVVEQYYTKKGERTTWWKGSNLITICRRVEH
jgi:ubiquinone/menaquinone biosynthesis C-methylase UbiE